VAIAGDILKRNSLASFGFIGEAGVDEPIKNTKRYRLYTLYVDKYFGPPTFSRFFSIETSAYFLQNMTNQHVTMEKARILFQDNYEIDL